MIYMMQSMMRLHAYPCNLFYLGVDTLNIVCYIKYVKGTGQAQEV